MTGCTPDAPSHCEDDPERQRLRLQRGSAAMSKKQKRVMPSIVDASTPSEQGKKSNAIQIERLGPFRKANSQRFRWRFRGRRLCLPPSHSKRRRPVEGAVAGNSALCSSLAFQCDGGEFRSLVESALLRVHLFDLAAHSRDFIFDGQHVAESLPARSAKILLSRCSVLRALAGSSVTPLNPDNAA